MFAASCTRFEEFMQIMQMIYLYVCIYIMYVCIYKPVAIEGYVTFSIDLVGSVYIFLCSLFHLK